MRSIAFWGAGWAPPWPFALPLLLSSGLFGAVRKNERTDGTWEKGAVKNELKMLVSCWPAGNASCTGPACVSRLLGRADCERGAALCERVRGSWSRAFSGVEGGELRDLCASEYCSSVLAAWACKLSGHGRLGAASPFPLGVAPSAVMQSFLVDACGLLVKQWSCGMSGARSLAPCSKQTVTGWW